MQDDRRGGWIQTYTGRAFWPLDPRPEDVSIEDIAHALAHQCRYSGHCRAFYSVAQHSVHVAQNLPRDLQLWGLLHDAAEAYLVDVPRPIKGALSGYHEAEARVMDAICVRFGLPPEMPGEVRRVDAAILADEMLQLMGAPAMAWNLPEPRLGIGITPWPIDYAKQTFRLFFDFLTQGRSDA